MSRRLDILALAALRNDVFPTLPKPVRDLFPNRIEDGVGVPNIIAGTAPELGVGFAMPLITVHSEGEAEGLVRKYRHLTMTIDFWTSQTSAGSLDGRNLISILYDYVFRKFHNGNFTANGIVIKRCYEIYRSPVLFEPPEKIYHIENRYKVEALSNSGQWY